MIIPGSQILIYPVLWILMPTETLQPETVPVAAPASTPPSTPPAV
jgi:hypothetical protein